MIGPCIRIIFSMEFSAWEILPVTNCYSIIHDATEYVYGSHERDLRVEKVSEFPRIRKLT